MDRADFLYKEFRSFLSVEATPCQERFLHTVASFLTGDEGDILVVNGYAGTGKTTAVSAVVEACYQLLRERRLFTHRISHPAARYYQSVESGTGLPALIEVAPSYVQHHYVPHYY